jgi:hypothetical protein
VDLAAPIIQNLIDTALALQTTTFTWILAAAGAIFLVSIFALAILTYRVKCSHSRPVQSTGNSLRRAMLFFTWTSTGLAFAAAFSLLQVIAAPGFQGSNLESITRISGGTASQALHWLLLSF